MATTKIASSTGGLIGPYVDHSAYQVAMQQAQMNMMIAQKKAELEAQKVQGRHYPNTVVYVSIMKNGGFSLVIDGDQYFAGDAQSIGEIVVGAMAAKKFRE
jgi:hypothetical protein